MRLEQQDGRIGGLETVVVTKYKKRGEEWRRRPDLGQISAKFR